MRMTLRSIPFRNFSVYLLFMISFIFLPRAWAEDRLAYDISATIDVAAKTIRAEETVHVVNNSSEDLKEIYFHIYPNRKYTAKEKNLFLRYAGYFKVDPFPEGFSESRFHLDSVSAGSEVLSFRIEGSDETLLKVDLKDPLKPGQAVDIAIAFNVAIPHAYGRFGWHDGIFALSRWYPILSVHENNEWKNYPFYIFHRPFYAQAAVYNVTLELPEEEVVIHSGELIKEEKLSDGKKKLTINSQLPIREFSLTLSTRYKVYEEDAQGVTIKSFYLFDEKKAKQAAGFVKDLFAYYSKHFGGYPYKQFSIAPVYLGYGGEQMSNLAFIDTRVFELPGFLSRYFDFLIAHEAGHQWFYNLVGINEYKEMWLDEGIHSYFILNYLESKYGRDASVLEYPHWIKKYSWLFPELTFRRTGDIRYQMIARKGSDHPIASELSSFSEPSSIFSLTYGKGSKVVEMLHETIGEESFNRIFTRIFKEYLFKNLSIDDFMNICTEESGKDLKRFFHQWLYAVHSADPAVVKVDHNKVTLEQKADALMPVDVDVTFADGKKTSFVWDGDRKKEEIVLSGAVESIRLDPDKKILELDRTNDSWPRRIHLQPVALYTGLYDVPALMPEDSYNLVFGPELANSGVGLKTSFQKPYDQNAYAASDYDFSEEILHSRAGYQLNNLFHSQTTLGFESANQTDFKDGSEDLVTHKVFLRKELWPVQYGLSEINDHVSLYVLQNRKLDATLLSGGAEDERNISYAKSNESIVGVDLYLNDAAPYPDPDQGYKFSSFFENAGHFWDGTQSFYRSGIDASFYKHTVGKQKAAARFKYGWGFPDDKNLYELGGIDGLRGYDRKEIRGANAVLTSAEYRFPVVDHFKLSLFDNILSFDALSAVIFFDAGEAWYDNFDDGKFKKDVGMGFRVSTNIGSFLEKVLIRIDVAEAIDEKGADPHVWFGINHAF